MRCFTLSYQGQIDVREERRWNAISARKCLPGAQARPAGRLKTLGY
jgi:hypothetical protein